MSESVRPGEYGQELDDVRLLTEVDHLLEGRMPDGSISPVVLDGVAQNLFTAVQEISMPAAVTTTIHRSEEVVYNGALRQMFTWMGRIAMRVPASGYQYHFSPQAHARVAVEEAEAARNQERVEPGVAQVLISPKMSCHDAPKHIAQQEHLHEDDAVRVSKVVTDAEGTVVARQLQSLLVRDIPLEAWVTMLQDPCNIFGKSLPIRNEVSALSVMELFSQLDLPEAALPEGPVTLVAAVLPYIRDLHQHASVQRQLEKFRSDQQLYGQKATEIAQTWLGFEVELAASLHAGRATLEIASFIASLQHQWRGDTQRLIAEHDTADGGYRMSRRLAACLEKAKQNVLNGEAAIATGNDEVLEQLNPTARQHIQERIKFIDTLQSSGVDEREIALQRAQLAREIADQNIAVGGGCPGKNSNNFGSESSDPLGGADGTNAERSSWKWTTGICKVRSCPSPKPTEVGPCSVCRTCQHVFDSGGDPTKKAPKPRSQQSAGGAMVLAGSVAK